MPLFRNLDENYDIRDEVEELDENYDELEGDGISSRGMQELLEASLVEKVCLMDDAEKKEYLSSDEFRMLEEAGKVGRRSLVRINKMDDLTRRTHLASLQKAKEMGDSDWDMLRKNRIKERQLLNRIYKKYASRVRRDAVKAQKRLIKLSPRAFDVTRVVR